MKKLLLVLFFAVIYTPLLHAQTTTIGILVDKYSDKSEPLLKKLRTEIKAVVGQNTKLVFKDVLKNNFDQEKAKANYQNFLKNDTDIILSFGAINNLMLSNLKEFKKPTIVFGSVNNDFIDIPAHQLTSKINNITYLITHASYTDDLNVFKSLSNYKNIGIIIDDFLINSLPIKNLFDKHFSKDKTATYKLIPLSKTKNIDTEINNVDAIYLASGFYLNKTEFKHLISEINEKKLPSFSAFGIRDVQKGILATNQPDTNIDQFFRRIALNIEAIISGTNASELPIHVDYKKKLTINHATADEIEFPLRYSMLASADFIEGNVSSKSDTSLSILDIMKGVVHQNLDLQNEQKNIDLTTQDVKTAKSNYLPDVKANLDASYLDPKTAVLSNGLNPEFSTSANATVSQLIYSENASANIHIQKELNNAQKEVYNTAELDGLLNASVAYFNALILKTNVSIQNRNLQVTKRNLELAKQNFEAGATSKADVLRFRSQLAQNTQQSINAGNELKQAYNTINQLLNTTISNKIDIKDAELSVGVFKNYKYQDFFELLDNPRTQASLIDFLVEEAKKNAPELKNIGHNINATQRNYKFNDTGRFIPTIALQGQYNYTFSQSGKGAAYPLNATTPPDGNYSIGLNVSLPIFQQNQRNINKKTAKIQLDQLTIQKKNTNLSLEKNVNDIVLNMVNQIANIEISKVSEETAKESLELTQNAYKNGAVPIIQLIDAQNNYFEAQQSRATANYNYLTTSMQLERSIGYFFLMHTESQNKEFVQKANQFILK